jgi:biopolymer transport protein ExbD
MVNDRGIGGNGEPDAPDFFAALQMVRKRRRKVNQAKRAAEEITYLNIVAMMDMMTIILVFLLKSVSFSSFSVSGSDALSLPYSSTQNTPIEAVKIFITKQEVVVEGTRVAELANGVIPDKYLDVNAERPTGYLIPNLKEVVTKEANRQLRLEKLGERFKFQGNLTILADKDTPYHVIMQVLYSAGQAAGGTEEQKISFDKFRLMVMRTAT